MMHQIKFTLPLSFKGSNELYVAVRAGMIARGTSLNAWCTANNINRQTAEKALRGSRHSPRAHALIERLVRDALGDQTGQ